MRKRTLKYGVLMFSFSIFILVYLLHFAQNRISLILNLGTNVPTELENISIQGRRGLIEIIFGLDCHSSATCKTTKNNFSDWLRSSEFEVIHFLPEDSITRQFYTKYDSLPKIITENNTDYIVQLRGNSNQSRLIRVFPIDNNIVFLEFSMDWN